MSLEILKKTSHLTDDYFLIKTFKNIVIRFAKKAENRINALRAYNVNISRRTYRKIL